MVEKKTTSRRNIIAEEIDEILLISEYTKPYSMSPIDNATAMIREAEFKCLHVNN